MIRRTIVLASMAFATCAFAQSLGEKTGVNSALGVAPTTADFVQEAAISDMAEIQSSEIAVERGNDAQKTFAQQMIADHKNVSEDMRKIATDQKIVVPSTLDDKHKKMIDDLKQASAADFIGDYTSMQVSAHKNAVSLFERYADGGENAQLKAFAGKTLPDLRHHLEMAQKLPTK